MNLHLKNAKLPNNNSKEGGFLVAIHIYYVQYIS